MTSVQLRPDAGFIRYAPLSPDHRQQLREEAAARRFSAIRTEFDQNRFDSIGRLRTRRRFWVSTAGPVLDALHEGSVLDFLRVQVGEAVYPTRSSYIYYEPGDHVGPHQDVQQCEITGLVSFGQDASTLTYPSGVGPDAEGAYAAFLECRLEPEVQMKLPHDSVTLFAGTELIHGRRPSSTFAVSVALCYSMA